MKNQCSNPDKSPDFCLNIGLQNKPKTKKKNTHKVDE